MCDAMVFFDLALGEASGGVLMAGEDLIDLLLELRKEKERYYRDPLRYARAIRDVARSFDPDARVYLFGSYVRGTMRPDSDIDVLVLTSSPP